MRILLVYARFPVTYWGFQHAMPLAGRAASLPPLGLVTLAALLPEDWELELVDLNVEPLLDAAILRADAVFVGGMLIQMPSMHEIVHRARGLGRLTAVGGPAVGASPEAFGAADVVFVGEAEGRVGELLAALSALGLPVGTAERSRTSRPRGVPLVLEQGARADMTTSPVPRFDLLRRDRYVSMCVQLSRGCPYACEFCDVTTQLGRTPRLKSTEQLLAEFEELRRLGYRGSLFVVDDNFIGNKRAVRALLPELARWQRRHGNPLELYTEATVTLAADPELVASMVEAGFTAVFLGIESPSKAALVEAKKKQNVRLDLFEVVRTLTRAGLEVMAGFIVGFDCDDPSIFAEQIAFINELPIPMAMAGLLTALPGTPLWERLGREGRLRASSTGDAFGRPNFHPAMDEATLVAGYADLLRSIYSEEAYFRRCSLYLELVAEAAMPTRSLRQEDLRGALRVLWGLGVRGKRRGHFFRLLTKAWRVAPHRFARAMTHAVMGEHLLRYTHEVVLPRLSASIVDIDRERAQATGSRRGARPRRPLPLVPDELAAE